MSWRRSRVVLVYSSNIFNNNNNNFTHSPRSCCWVAEQRWTWSVSCCWFAPSYSLCDLAGWLTGWQAIFANKYNKSSHWKMFIPHVKADFIHYEPHTWMARNKILCAQWRERRPQICRNRISFKSQRVTRSHGDRSAAALQCMCRCSCNRGERFFADWHIQTRPVAVSNYTDPRANEQVAIESNPHFSAEDWLWLGCARPRFLMQ